MEICREHGWRIGRWAELSSWERALYLAEHQLRVRDLEAATSGR